MMKFLAMFVGIFLLPLGSYADSASFDRVPAAQKDSSSKKNVKKKKVAKKSKGEAKKAKKSKGDKKKSVKKRVKKEPKIRSHAPKFQSSPAAEIGEIPEHLKDDLPPPNNGDLTE